MAEEILNALAQVKDLTVAGRTSSVLLQGQERRPAARSARRSASRTCSKAACASRASKVRITAQLIRTDNGTHLWSKAFDGDLKDVFKLQEDIARAITDELQSACCGRPAAGAGRHQEPRGLRAVPQGDRHLRQRATGAHMADAAQQLEQAVEAGPGLRARLVAPVGRVSRACRPTSGPTSPDARRS
jgi:hypothetical protein